MKHRLIEVTLWIINIIAVLALFFALVITHYFYLEYGAEEGVLYGVMFIALALGVFGVLWIGNYVISGQKASLLETIKMIFGRVPYFGFIATVLYLGGIISALWNGSSDGVLWASAFAEGVGVALVSLLLGGFGRLYRPNKFLGHVFGTILVSILALFVSYQQTSLL